MIQAIIFDCFGVLYRDKKSLLYDLVKKEDWPELNDIIKATDHGYITRTEAYERVAALGGVTVEQAKALNERQYSRNEELFQLIQDLKKQYKIGLLTNVSDGLIDHLFTKSEQADFFDVVVQSWQEGVIKPAKEIYEVAAERLSLQPAECLMVDDIPRNVEGAELAGMQGLLFTANPELAKELEKLGITTNA